MQYLAFIMTHELKKIVDAYRKAKEKGAKSVLVTVVDLEGSSYRRPGVRMLIHEDGQMIGAVSGGCVEKEIYRQSDDVFKKGVSKTMTYDGRYRLGCEGILHILIEPFEPDVVFLEAFEHQLRIREGFTFISYFKHGDKVDADYGSLVKFGEKEFVLRNGFSKRDDLDTFEQYMKPCFKLVILGAEHDAVQVCSFAALTGWEVTIVSYPSEEKALIDFPGAKEFLQVEPENLDIRIIDAHTAVLIMTHNYVKDLKFLIRLKDCRPIYLGLLGPAKRREKLLGEFIERHPEVDYGYLEHIHGPAGLNIGGETAQEIAVSILAEILSVVRKQNPMLLKDKPGAIHN